MRVKDKQIEDAYQIAKQRFAQQGIDTDAVMLKLDGIPLSINCWQGDDVKGFENPDAPLTGGIQASGNYPGRPRNVSEFREDLEMALPLIPGKKRFNLHAVYLETDKPVERTAIEPKHFRGWVDLAKKHDLGLDLNPTTFSHPMADDNFTLSHPDPKVRKFWIDHCIACRTIAEFFGAELGIPAIFNIWIPDGFKDYPADRLSPRLRLKESLDEILASMDGKYHKVALEGKLFGIGTECYTTGSLEFYLGYAATRKVLLNLDSGHFHPTESVADKISSCLCFVDELVVHISRPERWDSDHVLSLDDSTIAIAKEIVRCGASRVYIGLDYFDASINRVAAWVIGARNLRKALLLALLEPVEKERRAENNFDFTTRLALSEEQKSMPWPAVWEYYCASQGMPVGIEWLESVRRFEAEVQSRRCEGGKLEGIQRYSEDILIRA